MKRPSPSSNKVGSFRGMSLIELMFAATMGVVTIAATMAVVNTQRTSAETSDRTINMYSDLQLGTSVMQRMMENVGYRFPSPKMAFIFHDNVKVGQMFVNGPGFEGTSYEYLGVVARDDFSTTAENKIVEGTDIVETFTGDDTRIPGMVVAVQPEADGSATVTFDTDAPLRADGSDDPVLGVTAGPLILFVNATTECVGFIAGGLTRTPALKANIKSLNSSPPAVDGNANNSEVLKTGGSFAGACPTQGMMAYIPSARARFMVLRGPNGVDRLAVQTTDLTTRPSISSGLSWGNINPLFAKTPTLLEPIVLVDGIEDMQVAPRVSTAGNTTLCPNKSASVDEMTIPGICYCSSVPTGVDGPSWAPCLNTGGINDDGIRRLVRGVSIRLASKGTPPYRKDPTANMPYMFNSFFLDPTKSDGYVHSMYSMNIEFPNLNPEVVATQTMGL